MRSRKWCEHITWDKEWNDYIISSSFVDIEIDKKLNYCPICGKPRPKELPKTTKEQK